MILKEPKKRSFMSRFKIFIWAEFVFAGFAYYQWSKMNRDQTYRYHMYLKNPLLLKVFYWSSDKMGYENIKEADYEAWGVHFNKKVEKLY